jgi:hypothetical protein
LCACVRVCVGGESGSNGARHGHSRTKTEAPPIIARNNNKVPTATATATETATTAAKCRHPVGSAVASVRPPRPPPAAVRRCFDDVSPETERSAQTTFAVGHETFYSRLWRPRRRTSDDTHAQRRPLDRSAVRCGAVRCGAVRRAAPRPVKQSNAIFYDTPTTGTSTAWVLCCFVPVLSSHHRGGRRRGCRTRRMKKSVRAAGGMPAHFRGDEATPDGDCFCGMKRGCHAMPRGSISKPRRSCMCARGLPPHASSSSSAAAMEGTRILLLLFLLLPPVRPLIPS